MRRFVPALMLGAVLLLPGTAAVAQREGKLDHLICYRMDDQLDVRATVDMLAELQPEFSQRRCRLEGAVEFCVPASKLNVEPPPALSGMDFQPLQDDYVCYNIRCRDQSQPPDKVVTDQFGRRVARNFRPRRICVPASEAPLLCDGPPNGAGRCGGACDDGSVCSFNPRSQSCACVQIATCSGRVDAAGMCGGTCTDPNTQCLPNADNRCQCLQPPTPTCEMNARAGMCGGACRGNLVCQANTDRTGPPCTCQEPPPAACGKDWTANPNQCGGSCPGGGACAANPVKFGPPCACPTPTPQME